MGLELMLELLTLLDTEMDDCGLWDMIDDAGDGFCAADTEDMADEADGADAEAEDDDDDGTIDADDEDEG